MRALLYRMYNLALCLLFFITGLTCFGLIPVMSGAWKVMAAMTAFFSLVAAAVPFSRFVIGLDEPTDITKGGYVELKK